MFTSCFRLLSHYCKNCSYLFVFFFLDGISFSVCSIIAPPIVSSASPSANGAVNPPILGKSFCFIGKLRALTYLACILLYLSVNSFSFSLYSCIDIEPFLYLFACVVSCSLIPLTLFANSHHTQQMP